MCHYKREQKKAKSKTKQTKEQKTKNKKTKKWSKPLIAALEEVAKISGIIFESRQRGSSV